MNNKQAQAEVNALRESTADASAEVAIRLRQLARRESRVRTGSLRDSWWISEVEIDVRKKKFYRHVVIRYTKGGKQYWRKLAKGRPQADSKALAVAIGLKPGQDAFVGSTDFRAGFHERGTKHMRPQPALARAAAGLQSAIVGEKPRKR